MSIKVTVRIGGNAGSTLWDATSQVPIFDDDSQTMLKAGQMYGGDGNASQFEFQVDDPIGEIPRAALTKNLASHNQVTVSESAPGFDCWIGRGRIADKGIDRGGQTWGDHRWFRVTVDDGNTDFRGLALAANWVRPAESGRARVLAALAAFCNGSPRLTTVIGTHLVAAGGEVIMPAKTYLANTDLPEIFRDCATTEGKLWGAVIHHLASVSHLCMLYIDEEDHTTYASTLAITDTSPDYVNSFPPIWDQGDAAIESGGDNPVSHLVSRYGSGDDSFVVSANSAIVTSYDYWAVPFNDSLSETVAQATIRAAAIRASRAREHVTHQVTLLIPATKVHLIGGGMSITMKSAASMGGMYLGTTQTRRIAQCKFEKVSPTGGGDEGFYMAHLQLDRPEKKLAERIGAPVGPKPPSAAVAEGVVVYEDWRFGEQSDPDTAQAELIANPYTAGAKAFALDPGGNLQCAIPNDGFGAVGTTACWALAQTGVASGEVLCTAGVVYRFAVRHTRYSPTYRIQVVWRDAGGSDLSFSTIFPTATPGAAWNDSTLDATAPVGATKFEIVKDNGAGLGVAVFFDRVTISQITAAVAGDTSTSVGGTGTGSVGTGTGRYADVTHDHEHDNITTGGPYHMAEDVTETVDGNVQTALTLLRARAWKQPVRAATAAAGTLATSFENGDTIDGVVLATGDRILIKDQAAGAENGIYTVNSTGAPTRGVDFDASSEVLGATTLVSEGTANADKVFICTTNAPITLGTTALVFAEMSGGVTDHGLLAGLADDDHTHYQKESEKGAASGYVPLGADGLIPDSYLPSLATSGRWEVLMSNTIPAEPLLSSDETDWLYGWVSGEAPSSLSAAELAYWQDRAALLDPDAYESVVGTSWTRTVTASETWYALGLWHVESGASYLFHRRADVERALILPAGTVLTADATQRGYAYLCKPSLVTGSDARYTSDPKGLYYDRLNKLRSYTQHDLTVSMAAAQAQGTLANATFPADFTDGLVVLASQHDVSWMALLNAAETDGLALTDEISDDHEVRFATPLMLPFKRTTFPKIRARAASVLGQASGFSSIAGEGGVKYFKLPSDW